MANNTVEILFTATDQTRGAISSVTSGLTSIAKQAAGTALGLAGFNGISSIFNGITDTVFGMNNSLDATGKQAATMLDSIRTSSVQAGQAIQATAKQTQDWARQLRDIQERESDGLQSYADKTADIVSQINDILSGKNLQKMARDQNETLNDMAQDHADRVAQLQDEMTKEQQKGIYVNGELYQQGNQQRIADLQGQIDRENHEYDKQVERKKRDFQEAVDDQKAADDQRLADLRKSLDDQKTEELRFTRDIKEAYGDLANAKQLALSAGGSGGLAQGSQAVITYRQELQKLGKTGQQIFDQFAQYFKEEGVRSPFNVADIQQAGAQLIQYSGGNLQNMEKIVRMAEALASSPAVQQFDSSERLNLGIRALSEAYNGQFISLQRIFNIAGPTFDGLQKGTFSTTEFTDKLNQSLEATGINYNLVEANSQTLDGAWGNLVETGKLLLANITSPIYAAFRDELVRINDWVTKNQGAINAWADDIKNRLAKYLDENLMKQLHNLEQWFKDYITSGQWKKDLGGIADSFNAIGGAVKGVADLLDKVGDGMKTVQQNQQLFTQNPLDFFKGTILGIGKLITGKAVGGPVAAGTPYIVGERGQELFVPSQPGTIVPADQTSQILKGGSGPTVHIEHATFANDIDLSAFARELSWRLG